MNSFLTIVVMSVCAGVITIQSLEREDYRGFESHETIQTWREYLCDASFTVALSG